MFGPNNIANPTGTAGAFDFRAKLMKALNIHGKSKHTSPEKRIAELFYSSSKAALAIMPYITPKLRTLEVSGQVVVPFQFIVERHGQPVVLPADTQPVKQIGSKVVTLANSSLITGIADADIADAALAAKPIRKSKKIDARRKAAAKRKDRAC